MCLFLTIDDPKYLTWIAVKFTFMFGTTYLVWSSPVRKNAKVYL